MSLANASVLKIVFANDTRRAQLSEITFSFLKQALSTLFDDVPTDTKLHYVDDEGDRVLITSTPELLEAFALARTEGKTLKVFATVPNKNGDASVRKMKSLEDTTAKQAKKAAKTIAKIEAKEIKQEAKQVKQALKAAQKDAKKEVKITKKAAKNSNEEPTETSDAPKNGLPTRKQLLASLSIFMQDLNSNTRLRAGLAAFVDSMSPGDPCEPPVAPSQQLPAPSVQIMDILGDANLPDETKSQLTCFLPHLCFKLDKFVMRAMMGGGRGGRGRDYGCRRGGKGHHGHHGKGRRGKGEGKGGKGEGFGGGPRRKLKMIQENFDSLPQLLATDHKLNRCFEHAYQYFYYAMKVPDEEAAPVEAAPSACSYCNQALAVPQFHCTVCPARLCATCEASGVVHPVSHPLLKFAQLPEASPFGLPPHGPSPHRPHHGHHHHGHHHYGGPFGPFGPHVFGFAGHGRFGGASGHRIGHAPWMRGGEGVRRRGGRGGHHGQ